MRQCFLFNEKFNFKDFYMEIGMYVHFCHTKKYSQKKLKNWPKLQNSKNGLKFQYARKNPFFIKRYVISVIDSFLSRKGIEFFKIKKSICGSNI